MFNVSPIPPPPLPPIFLLQKLYKIIIYSSSSLERRSLNTGIHPMPEFFRNLVKNDWSSAIGNVFLIGYVCASRAQGSYDRLAGYFYSLTNLSMFRDTMNNDLRIGN